MSIKFGKFVIGGLEEKFILDFGKLFPIKTVVSKNKSIQFGFVYIPYLTCFINETSIGIQVDCRDVCIDFMCWLDHHINQTDDGRYFCDSCVEDKRKYWKSRDELVREHSYTPFMDWCKENLVEGNFLLMFDLDGGSYARICTPEQVSSSCEIPNLKVKPAIDLYHLERLHPWGKRKNER